MRLVLAYGGWIVGLATNLGGVFYRIAAGNPGGPPQALVDDGRTVRRATAVILAGGLVAIGGPFAAFWVSRSTGNDEPPQ